MKKKSINLKLIIPLAILLIALVFSATYFYPIIRANHDPKFVPKQIRDALTAETKIMEDMYISAEMIQAVFDLPMNERVGSAALQTVTKQFEERVESKRVKSIRLQGASIDTHQFEFAFIKEETENEPAQLIFFVATDHYSRFGQDMVDTAYHYFVNGDLTVRSRWQFNKYVYGMRNTNNEDHEFYKNGITNTQIDITWDIK